MTATRFVCPFCPLHCDDLEPSTALGVGSACPILRERGLRSLAHDRDTLPPDPTTLEQAQQWVRAARTIAISGRVIDLETARAVSRFASRTGAGLLPLAAPDDVYPEVFARRGGIGTTIGETASPHQTVIVIGNPDSPWPQLRQRLTGAGKVFYWQRNDQIVPRLARLRGDLARPASRTQADPGGTGDEDVTTTMNLVRDSETVAFLIVPTVVAVSDQRLLWSTVGGLIADLNRQTRATLLRLDEALTLRSVRAWTSAAAATNAIEPDALDASVQLTMIGDVDLVIDLIPWDHPAEPAEDPVRRGERADRTAMGTGSLGRQRITIGQAAGGGAGMSSSLHLPASTPGISARSMAIRGDGSVALPLGKWGETELPTVAEWLQKLAM
jgi:hypothetical protein